MEREIHLGTQKFFVNNTTYNSKSYSAIVLFTKNEPFHLNCIPSSNYCKFISFDNKKEQMKSYSPHFFETYYDTVHRKKG